MDLQPIAEYVSSSECGAEQSKAVCGTIVPVPSCRRDRDRTKHEILPNSVGQRTTCTDAQIESIVGFYRQFDLCSLDDDELKMLLSYLARREGGSEYYASVRSTLRPEDRFKFGDCQLWVREKRTEELTKYLESVEVVETKTLRQLSNIEPMVVDERLADQIVRLSKRFIESNPGCSSRGARLTLDPFLILALEIRVLCGFETNPEKWRKRVRLISPYLPDLDMLSQQQLASSFMRVGSVIDNVSVNESAPRFELTERIKNDLLDAIPVSVSENEFYTRPVLVVDGLNSGRLFSQQKRQPCDLELVHRLVKELARIHNIRPKQILVVLPRGSCFEAFVRCNPHLSFLQVQPKRQSVVKSLTTIQYQDDDLDLIALSLRFGCSIVTRDKLRTHVARLPHRAALQRWLKDRTTTIVGYKSDVGKMSDANAGFRHRGRWVSIVPPMSRTQLTLVEEQSSKNTTPDSRPTPPDSQLLKELADSISPAIESDILNRREDLPLYERREQALVTLFSILRKNLSFPFERRVTESTTRESYRVLTLIIPDSKHTVTKIRIKLEKG